MEVVMSKVKVNTELWKAISEKEKEGIASSLNLEIVQESNVPVPKPEDILYGMTIKEAAMLLAKKNKRGLLSKIENDIETETVINKSLEERRDDLPHIVDAISKREKMRKKNIDLNKDESVVFDEIKKDLIKNISSIKGVNQSENDVIYGETVGDVSCQFLYQNQKIMRSNYSSCFYQCCEENPDSWQGVCSCYYRNCL
jgi:hypothetical protein